MTRVFWRRRLVALGALAAVAFALGVLVSSGADDRDGSAGPSPRAGLPPEPVRFTVAASGDLLIHGPVFGRALANGGGRRYDFRPMLRSVRRWVSRADLALCHLEQPLTPGQPTGEPVFRAPEALGGAIRWTGWDVCSTASNHALDGGQGAVDFTARTLDRLGIRHSGSFSSERRRRRPVVLDVKGVRVAFLSYVQRSIPGIPRPPHPWSLAFADAAGILEDARIARREGAGMVIVNLHWGDEYRHEPSAFQRRLADRLTDSGLITAIVGQHAHVVQPIRRVNGKVVVFGEGNLLSNQTAACCPVASQDGMVVFLDVVAGPRVARIERVRYRPTWVRHPDFRVVAAPSGSYRRTVAVVGRGPGLQPTR